VEKKITFVVELNRCIGCHGCQVACKQENGVPLGADRTRVRDVGPTGTYPDIQMYFLPAMCQHCENPPCAAVCPTGACWQDPADGVVKIDRDVCIGCKTCAAACPYQVNCFREDMRVMDKCDACAALRAAGEDPACVKNCPGRALHVGDLNDPESEVSRILASAREGTVHTLRDSGSGPSVRYVLHDAKWLDVLPQDCGETKRGRF